MSKETIKESWKWALPIIISIVMSGFTYAYTSGKSDQRMESFNDRIEVNTDDIKILETEKASKEMEEKIFDALDRIESKLDSHLLEH